jgi:ZIP family zinc transporter
VINWLWADALAPGLGIAATGLFSVSRTTLAMLLALFSGLFVYIGACDLIPESFRALPKVTTTLSTLAGVAVLYLAITWASS